MQINIAKILWKKAEFLSVDLNQSGESILDLSTVGEPFERTESSLAAKQSGVDRTAY